VLYDDAALLAINKPAGLLTIPDGYNAQLPSVKTLLEKIFGHVWIVHRLDKETSGVLLLARNAEMHRELNMLFDHRMVEKVYHAIVRGNPPWQQISCREALRINGDRNHRTIIDPQRGKPAQTDFIVLKTFTDCVLIEAHPRTGYTHQIRAHLSSLGYPILSDGLYGDKIAPLPKTDERIPRLALHAWEVKFAHPLTNDHLVIRAPYPSEFVKFLTLLENQSPRQGFC
jgi:RluA family pseudouridine synthase